MYSALHYGNSDVSYVSEYEFSDVSADRTHGHTFNLAVAYLCYFVYFVCKVAQPAAEYQKYLRAKVRLASQGHIGLLQIRYILRLHITW